MPAPTGIPPKPIPRPAAMAGAGANPFANLAQFAPILQGLMGQTQQQDQPIVASPIGGTLSRGTIPQIELPMANPVSLRRR